MCSSIDSNKYAIYDKEDNINFPHKLSRFCRRVPHLPRMDREVCCEEGEGLSTTYCVFNWLMVTHTIYTLGSKRSHTNTHRILIFFHQQG